MSKIHLLSEETINQIAAGEVIENPASVVKELVENSVDAGATDICVMIRGGGLQYISISDDGIGMSEEDALLSLQRHATSKIQSSEDLFRLATMGFRGEALASIAAISKMTLITSLQELGIRIEIEGGKIVEVVPHPRTRGTTIEVRSLFYNVPARKKFQKSPNLCASDVSKVMTLMGLAHPSVAMTYLKHEEQVFKLLSQHPERPKILLGDAFIEGCTHLNGSKIRGILANPLQSRPNRSGQYVFLNGRPIISSAIGFAVRDGYGTRLSENRYPLFLLYLEVDPESVDVNVHPQKKEVRFQNESLLKAQIREAVSSAFESSPPLIFSTAPSFSPPHIMFAPMTFREEPTRPVDFVLPFIQETSRSLGIYGEYYFVEEEGELWVVDLSLAQQALIEQKTLSKQITAQGVLFPETFEVSQDRADALCFFIPQLKEVGFEVSQIGPRGFMIEAIPSCLEEGNLKEVVCELIQFLEAKEDLLSAAAHLFARSCRRFKRNFVLQEAEVLYREIKKNPGSFSRGKPIRIQLHGDQIARFFSK